MFAYCNNNPANYCDSDGYSPGAVIIDGIIAGFVSLINAAVFGATGAEIVKAFVSGFLQGVVCSATSGVGIGTIIKYAVILYDVGSAVYESLQSGASVEECAIVALMQLWAALSFDSLDTDQLFDLVFGLGTTLCASGVTEGIRRKNLSNEISKEDISAHPSQQLTAGKKDEKISSTVPGCGGFATRCCLR